MPAVGAEEVAVRGVVVTIRLDEVGTDRAPAAVAEDPGRLAVGGGCPYGFVKPLWGDFSVHSGCRRYQYGAWHVSRRNGAVPDR